MNDLWGKFDRWLEVHFPEGYQSLNPGASEEEILKLELEIGFKLPEAYRYSLKIHDGQKYDSIPLLDSGEFLSIDRVRDEWRIMKELLDKGQFPPNKFWWSINWVPITSDGSGNLTCIDMRKGLDKNLGQIIDFDHEVSQRTILSQSFESWFEAYVIDVLAGKYGYSDDYGLFMPKEDH